MTSVVALSAAMLKPVGLACCALTAAALAAAGMAVASRRALKHANDRIAKLQADLTHEEGKYKQERVGRIRMQKKLEGEVGFNVHHGGMQSIGRLDSVFRKRFGTPRQGLVVPYARARLKIDSQHYPKDSLDGLQEYSHVWLIYLFHANTNTARRTKEQTSAVRAKVRPPRLGGKTVGLFSTRTPHRPNPIGLSLVKLDRVAGDTLHLSSVDLVHGTPVLDIKPYLPYADSIAGATVPQWVVEPPVASLGRVTITDEAMQQMRSGKYDFFTGGDEFALALEQLLSSAGDIRSENMRSSQKWSMQANRFTFDNYEVSFSVDEHGGVTVLGIALADLQNALLLPENPSGDASPLAASAAMIGDSAAEAHGGQEAEGDWA